MVHEHAEPILPRQLQREHLDIRERAFDEACNLALELPFLLKLRCRHLFKYPHHEKWAPRAHSENLRNVACRVPDCRYSRTIVTGPSFTSSTGMRAPKRPVSTWIPSSRRAVAKRSYRRSAVSGRAAREKLGRLPLAVSAMSVNWLTTSAELPVSRSDRSNFPSSF